jgi:hypothetical protein
VGSGRRWSLLLVPGGVAAGHVLGYGAAGVLGSAPALTGGHGYLDVLLRLGVPFTLTVLARAFLCGARSELPPVRFRDLAVLQVAVFATIEVGEHAAAGIGPAHSLVAASLWLGLLAQILVAAGLVALTAWLRRVGAAVAGGRRRRPAVALPRPRSLRSLVAVPAIVAVGSLSRRGPPVVLVR